LEKKPERVRRRRVDLNAVFGLNGYTIIKAPRPRLGRKPRPRTRLASDLSRRAPEQMGMALDVARETILLALVEGTVINPWTRKPIRVTTEDAATLVSDWPKVSGRTVRRIRERFRDEREKSFAA
jgi:hypothetical protein